MIKDTQRGRKGKNPRTVKKTKVRAARPAAPASEPSPTHAHRVVELGRSIVRKGAHDAAADIVKRVILWGGGALLLLGGGYYFGVDIGPWLGRHPAPIETGSILKPAKPAAPDPEAKKREIECNVGKAREVDAAVERRKTAFGIYTKCLVEWKPAGNEKQTAEQACAPKLAEHQKIAQEVRDKQAKDCAAAAVAK
jgi:hypothetical protein